MSLDSSFGVVYFLVNIWNQKVKIKNYTEFNLAVFTTKDQSNMRLSFMFPKFGSEAKKLPLDKLVYGL